MTDTGWTTPDDIRRRIRKLWDAGRVLDAAIGDSSTFPMRVALRRPTAPELSANFDAARAWVNELRALRRVTIESNAVNHRQLGRQELPSHLLVASADDAAAIIGRSADLARFRRLISATPTDPAGLVAFARRRPFEVLAADDDWRYLTEIVRWLAANPRPGIFVRQLDLLGVHTKLIDQHRKLLTAMLEAVLPADAIDHTARTGDFARRFGFLAKPRLVRFRTLDRALRVTAFDHDGDHQMTAADFARMPPPQRVFITENEVNFLAFPDVANAVVVFGAGSGLEHLATAGWLADCEVHYWGDLDTHGFWILDQLRAIAPHAHSLLMDRATLLAHQDRWGVEPVQRRTNLTRLTPEEDELYDDLRDNRIRANLRLEQEHVRFADLERALDPLRRVD